jgi:uncharacterized protein
MLLNLASILDSPGARLPYQVSLDLSDLTFGSNQPVCQPVQAEGVIRNTAGVLVMTGSIRTTLHCVCDRCTAEFQRGVDIPVDAVLVSQLSQEEDEEPNVFELTGDSADLEEIITTIFVLNMDSKFLCSEDCKGLCFRCGKNLNEGPCSCQKEPDPRFAALKQLLNK